MFPLLSLTTPVTVPAGWSLTSTLAGESTAVIVPDAVPLNPLPSDASAFTIKLPTGGPKAV